jgi:hypothetical protein
VGPAASACDVAKSNDNVAGPSHDTAFPLVLRFTLSSLTAGKPISPAHHGGAGAKPVSLGFKIHTGVMFGLVVYSVSAPAMEPINWRLSNMHVPLDYSSSLADKP